MLSMLAETTDAVYGGLPWCNRYRFSSERMLECLADSPEKQTMTDSERQACKRIAKAMGLEGRDAGGVQTWTHPHPTGFAVRRGPCPNFFTEPDAADALMRWLRDEKYLVQLVPVADMPHRGHGVTILRSGAEGTAIAQASHHDWKTALALAADAAIQEAERVKK